MLLPLDTPGCFGRAELQCQSGRPALRSSRHRLRTPASAAASVAIFKLDETTRVRVFPRSELGARGALSYLHVGNAAKVMRTTSYFANVN